MDKLIEAFQAYLSAKAEEKADKVTALKKALEAHEGDIDLNIAKAIKHGCPDVSDMIELPEDKPADPEPVDLDQEIQKAVKAAVAEAMPKVDPVAIAAVAEPLKPVDPPAPVVDAAAVEVAMLKAVKPLQDEIEALKSAPAGDPKGAGGDSPASGDKPPVTDGAQDADTVIQKAIKAGAKVGCKLDPLDTMKLIMARDPNVDMDGRNTGLQVGAGMVAEAGFDLSEDGAEFYSETAKG